MKTVRIVSYAINGRGLGHLVRQLAILRWVRRLGAALGVRTECWVLTSSEADTLARREGIPALKMPSKAMLRDAGLEPARYLTVARTWVLNAIAGLAPDVLVVDTFPGGSFGELIAALELAPHRVLVARAVKEEIAEDTSYRGLLPMYDATIEPDERGVGPILLREREELLPRDEARAALGVPDGARAVYVSLGGGGDEGAPHALPRLCDLLVARGWHVVVGAGPLYVGPERRGPGITWMDRYVPLELLAGVDAAVSAAGYNAVTELMFAGVPAVLLPQHKLADDQAARARAVEAAGAGRVAASLDEVPALLGAPGSSEAARGLVPGNGARAAAAVVLSRVLPADEVERAAALLSPDVVAALRRLGGRAPLPSDKRTFEVLRALGGGAVLAGFLDAAARAGAPWDEASALVLGLRRAFPGAEAGEVGAAVVGLLDGFARFEDWMGAVSILRAVPTQRVYPIGGFVGDLRRWLDGVDDLYDALRDLTRLEGAGRRPLADVLGALARRELMA